MSGSMTPLGRDTIDEAFNVIRDLSHVSVHELIERMRRKMIIDELLLSTILGPPEQDEQPLDVKVVHMDNYSRKVPDA